MGTRRWSRSHTQLGQLLLDNRAAGDAVNDEGWTVFMQAASEDTRCHVVAVEKRRQRRYAAPEWFLDTGNRVCRRSCGGCNGTSAHDGKLKSDIEF
ncbi:hypothetical protein ON010_g4720 [Phytophthora cinnamomi]|nr:hypothetical protein ON010_g4720 [Phytophthora cinnamomi]